MHRNRISRAAIAAIGLAFAGSSAFAADALGTLEAEGAYELRASGTSEFVRFNQSGATWYAGDTLRTRGGSAVLNLDAGGGLGLHEQSQATVMQAADGELQIELAQGKLLYALPDARRPMVVRAGNFTLSTAADEAVRTNVNAGDQFIGAVQRLADGNLRIEVRSGQLNVRNGDAHRVSVGAGETVGLLDLPLASELQVQSGAVPVTAPESVAPTAQFEVTVDASNASGEYLVISERGAPASEFESVVTMGGDPVTYLDAPATPGEYEVRVIDDATGAVLGFANFTVSAPAGAAVVGAGSTGGGIWAPAMAVAGGAIAIYIIDETNDDDDDDDPDPVSP